MNALKDLKLDDLYDELRSQASRRLDDLRSEGRKQARSAAGGRDDTTRFVTFAVGLLAGAFAGAAIALLITPFSGKQARAKLSERVDKIRTDIPTTIPTRWGGDGNGKAVGSYEPTYSSPKPS